MSFTQKLEARKAALQRTSALTDDKKARWREVLMISFMSSEESREDENGHEKRPVLYVKALPWRAPLVNRFFNQLDQK